MVNLNLKGLHIMTYPEFRELVFENVLELIPKGVSIRLLDVEKLNNALRYGIVFTKEEMPFSPTIYLEPFYSAFLRGEDIHILAKEIVRCYQEETLDIPLDALSFAKFNEAKHFVFAKLIHFNENIKLLAEVPHKRFLDFAIIPYLEVDCQKVNKGTVILKRILVENWEISEEELLLLALQNTKDNKRVFFRTIAEVLESKFAEDEMAIFNELSEKMYVLTNEEKYFGAVCVFYPEVLRMICDMFKESFYLLPASVHEWIVLPASSVIDEGYLRYVVRKVNESELLPEEVLSSNVYLYDSQTETIRIT